MWQICGLHWANNVSDLEGAQDGYTFRRQFDQCADTGDNE